MGGMSPVYPGMGNRTIVKAEDPLLKEGDKRSTAREEGGKQSESNLLGLTVHRT